MIPVSKRIGLCLALTALGGVPMKDLVAAASAKPHLVLYLADDLGHEFTGFGGNQAVQTPHLDRLAREGLSFNRAFAVSPTCSPSRAALLTGLYPQRNGMMGNHTECRPGIKSLPAYLQELGYRVVAVNKTDVRPRSVFGWESLDVRLPVKPGFARRYRSEGLDPAKLDAFIARHAGEKPDQPLCLLIGDANPHVLWEHNRDFEPERLPLTPVMVDTPITRRALANYYQEIKTLDRNVGEVLASLARHGLESETLFIFVSDQGAEWPRAKWTLYDAGLRVPMIVRWPGRVPAGKTTEAMVSLIDLTPTLVDVAGGRRDENWDGRSFAPLLRDPGLAFRTEIFGTHTGDGTMNRFPQRAIRDGRYKLILNLHPDRPWTTHFTLVPGIQDSHKEVWDEWVARAAREPAVARLIDLIQHRTKSEELYDLAADPHELSNLAEQPEMAAVKERLRGRLDRWREQMQDGSDG